MSKLMRFEEELHKRVISQGQSHFGAGSGHPSRARGAEKSCPPGGLLPVPGSHRRGQEPRWPACLAQFLFGTEKALIRLRHV